MTSWRRAAIVLGMGAVIGALIWILLEASGADSLRGGAPPSPARAETATLKAEASDATVAPRLHAAATIVGRALLNGEELALAGSPTFESWRSLQEEGEARMALARVGAAIDWEAGFAGDGDLLTGEAAAEASGRAASPGLFVVRGVLTPSIALVVRGGSLHEQRFDVQGLEASAIWEQDLHLKPGAILEASVRHHDGQPAARRRMIIRPAGGEDGTQPPWAEDGQLTSWTDDQGIVSMRCARPHHRYEVLDGVDLSNHASGVAGTTVRSGASGAVARCSLSLPKPSGIRVRVVDAEGRPIEGMGISATSRRTSTPYSKAEVTNAEGWTGLLTFPAGRVEVVCTEGGRSLMARAPFAGVEGSFSKNGAFDRADAAAFSLAKGEEREVLLRVPGHGRLEVRVTCEGRPVANAIVDGGRGPQPLLSELALLRRAEPLGRTDAKGLFVREEATGGSWTIRIFVPGAPHLHQSVQVLVVEGETATASFALPATRITGKVTDATGLTLSEVRVRLEPREVEMLISIEGAPASSTAGGRFDLSYVDPESSWSLVLSKPGFGTTWHAVRGLRVGMAAHDVGVVVMERAAELRVKIRGAVRGTTCIVRLQPEQAPVGSQTRFEHAKSDQQAARFESLSPGRYTLSTRQEGPAGRWSDPIVVAVRAGESSEATLRIVEK